MSEYEQVIDEIVKHGVAVKVNKIVDDNYINHERKYVGCVVEIDFSEHDKVFEDKIAEQKNEISMRKALANHYRDAESKLFDENESLKQRIAELEDKIGDRDEINRCLREQIDELESKENIIEVRVPASPMEIATHLINNTCTINELKMIAEHINVYCNGGK